MSINYSAWSPNKRHICYSSRRLRATAGPLLAVDGQCTEDGRSTPLTCMPSHPLMHDTELLSEPFLSALLTGKRNRPRYDPVYFRATKMDVKERDTFVFYLPQLQPSAFKVTSASVCKLSSNTCPICASLSDVTATLLSHVPRTSTHFNTSHDLMSNPCVVTHFRRAPAWRPGCCGKMVGGSGLASAPFRGSVELTPAETFNKTKRSAAVVEVHTCTFLSCFKMLHSESNAHHADRCPKLLFLLPIPSVLQQQQHFP